MKKHWSWRYMILSLGLLLTLALAAACAAPETAAPAAPSGADAPAAAAPAPEQTTTGLREVPRDRTLIVMAGGPNQYTLWNNYHPYIPGSGESWFGGQGYMEPLIMFNVLTGDYENWLLEDWAYNDDFTEITLFIREGVRWADGTAFTADDIVFTFNTLRDNAGAMVALADLPNFLERAEKVDESTAKLILNRPNPTFWATTLTTNHGVFVLPKHVWEGQDMMEFTNFNLDAGLPLGTGPYKLVFASPQQRILDLREDWWAVETGFKARPQVERIIYLPAQDESQAAQLLITNQIDMSPILQVATLRTVFQQNPKVQTFTGQEPPFGYLDWCPIDLNLNTSVEPWNDRDIRWALAYAIDRERLVALAESGAGVPALHQFTPYAWFAPFEEALQEIFAEYDYGTSANLDRTNEIMEGKGYTKNSEELWVDGNGNTIPVNFFTPEYLRGYAPPLAQQLRDAGFDATFDLSPGLGSAVQTGEQTEALGCKGPSGVLGMDPYFMLSIYTSQYYRPTGEPAPIWWATSRWQNAEYDAIVDELSLLQADDPRVKDLFVEAMQIWVDEMPDIYLGQLIIRYPMSTQYWTNWPVEGNVYGFPHSWQKNFLLSFINLEPAQ
jgi:peptide/nickel transport system substrate-binding protein